MREVSRGMTEKKMMTILIAVFSAVVAIGITAAILLRTVFTYEPEKGSSSVGAMSESSQIVSNQSSIASSETSSVSDKKDDIVYESDDGTNFNVPSVLRAVYLKPGQDFLLKTSNTADMIKKQIDSAMQSTAKLGFNSVILFTETAQGVLYDDPVLKVARTDIDITAYVIESAKKHNLYSYIVFPVLLQNKNGSNDIVSDFSKYTFDNLEKRVEYFSKKYSPSAIVLDSYEVSKTDDMESCYLASKSPLSYENYLREQVSLAMRNARNTVRKNNNTSQVGFLAYGVWANYASDKSGSQTSSNYQSYINGFADTRSMVLNDKYNFVMVENLMPTDSVKNNFKVIASWWSALCSQTDTTFYNVHAASKLNTSLGEFVSPDQLILQVSIVSPLKAFGGCIFDSLPALVADYDGSTTLLLKYFNNSLEQSAFMFNKLQMSAPTKNNITTYDNTITFSGATDPNFKVTINGKEIEVNDKGYFSIEQTLKVGNNTYKISHKGVNVTYNVTKKIKIIDSVAPTGIVEIDGGTIITLTAKAYTGAKVTAQIGGKTVVLEEKKSQEVVDENTDNKYATFEGSFKAPDATQDIQNLGAIAFTATWQGYNEKASGATVKIFAKPVSNKNAVQIKTEHAETFPTDRLNDQSQPYCYPLPAGTTDYIVGNELVFTNSSGTYKYYKLQSGHRVYSKDVTFIENLEEKINNISAVEIGYDGRYINLNISNTWNVPFKYIEEPIKYTNSSTNPNCIVNGDYKVTKITYRLFYTETIDTDNIKLDENPLISKVDTALKNIVVDGIDIPVCDIILTLKTPGGFFGARPYYNDTTLNIKLNAPAPIQVANNSYGYTLNGATIIIDAGHDKNSPGANGALMDPVTNKPAFPEYVMNANVRDSVAEILKGLGANVITIDNSVYNTAVKRLAYFKAQNPHIMISIHHNSLYSYNSGATGRYFNAYSQQLCKYISESVRSNYVNNTTNVGAYDFDRLNMTREQYYPSMLLEVGFISNPNEQNELVKPENQQKIAEQIVKGMINYFKATGSLNHKVEEPTPPQTEEGNTPTEEPTPPETTPDTSTETLAYIEKKTQTF